MVNVTTRSNTPVAMLSQSWALYKLWANSMDDATALAILDSYLVAIGANSLMQCDVTPDELRRRIVNEFDGYARGISAATESLGVVGRYGAESWSSASSVE